MSGNRIVGHTRCTQSRNPPVFCVERSEIPRTRGTIPGSTGESSHSFTEPSEFPSPPFPNRERGGFPQTAHQFSRQAAKPPRENNPRSSAAPTPLLLLFLIRANPCKFVVPEFLLPWLVHPSRHLCSPSSSHSFSLHIDI